MRTKQDFAICQRYQGRWAGGRFLFCPWLWYCCNTPTHTLQLSQQQNSLVTLSGRIYNLPNYIYCYRRILHMCAFRSEPDGYPAV